VEELLVVFLLGSELILIDTEKNDQQKALPSVISVTEARLVNTLTSRSRVISTLGRYNQKCGVVENEYV
jgi:hypothetical protein